MKNDIDSKILKILQKEGRTTYSIAKKVGISWSTANIHLYKLKINGKIERRLVDVHGKLRTWKQEVWFIKRGVLKWKNVL